jgi:phosphoribosylanthranilate isomerase
MAAMVKAKICGLSTPDTVQAALDGGAAFLGFVFFEKSPRNLAPEAAARLAEPARGRNTPIVAVVVDPSDDLLDRLVATLGPDLVQLHGRETPERVAAVRARTGAGIIKALAIEHAEDLAAAGLYAPLVDHLMLDAKPPKDSALPGGVGHAFDWTLLAGRRFERPWFLVDVSSGVERGPGYKDPHLISAFLEAVRRA